jgi:hypothetical protein
MDKRRYLLFLAILAILPGCTAQLQRPATAVTSYDCAALDHDHRTWGAVAKFSGALSGTGALATLPMSDEQKTLRISVAVAAALLGALTPAAIYIEQDAASTWAKKCAGP